jgi:hypothetical protein
VNLFTAVKIPCDTYLDRQLHLLEQKKHGLTTVERQQHLYSTLIRLQPHIIKEKLPSSGIQGFILRLKLDHMTTPDYEGLQKLPVDLKTADWLYELTPNRKNF